ncbi:hypothetical protein JTB14_026149 [Gonioctena quinquepunctata]|nr:hypothetical protein JTB14_026149 [Gonioctena quinquepunctata]
MVEWIGTLDLVVHNRGDKHTFLRGNRQSWVDVTCSTQGIARYLKGWRILDDEPVSDHALIAYELAGKAGSQKQRHLYTTDWDAFRENLDWRIQGSVDDDSAETCSRLMKEAYRSSGTRETLSRKPY